MTDPKPYFFTLSFNDCQNLQWQLGRVWFLGTEGLSDVIPKTEIIINNYYSCIENACHVKTKKTYIAGQQCTGPERGGGENKYETMYMVN